MNMIHDDTPVIQEEPTDRPDGRPPLGYGTCTNCEQPSSPHHVMIDANGNTWYLCSDCWPFFEMQAMEDEKE